jgi:hypothetical protein
MEPLSKLNKVLLSVAAAALSLFLSAIPNRAQIEPTISRIGAPENNYGLDSMIQNILAHSAVSSMVMLICILLLLWAPAHEDVSVTQPD